ncbi:hypothetical protein B0H14DRAFT_2514480 [Mycena olivaceomarginata]|nr:hypothetical protein B0H14DRAFT_2514480 [Mycena olivaceomarginata]
MKSVHVDKKWRRQGSPLYGSTAKEKMKTSLKSSRVYSPVKSLWSASRPPAPAPRLRGRQERAVGLVLRTPISRLSILPIKKARSGPDDEGETPDDHTLALALQKQWEEEDGVARKRAAEDEERSQQLIARLQAMDEKMDKKRHIAPQKRRKGGQNNAVPEDGIMFKVVVDADGNTLEGDPDPDNVALELVKRVFEEPGPDMLGRHLTLVSVTWFVNVKLEARFEAAKELLASLGIDNSERSLFHGTAANSIQPILEGGKMANGKTEGYGIYLAPTASASLGNARGINKMFMCRGTLLSPSHNSCLFWTNAISVITGRISNESR